MSVNAAVSSDDAQIETPKYATLSVGNVELQLSLSDVFNIRSGLRRESWRAEKEGRTFTAESYDGLKRDLAAVAYELGGRNETLLSEMAAVEQ
ncbi:hypothetical protein [Halobellus limi]|uniref:Uncharacterized protein n=1 Tax=Halobellus limi TaxID=699433 RepID=A0A1H5ZGL8_9EURY|nr:hypothetical protein [Halobellus limi]QCC48109.1 hypothetical protein DV707_10795 [Halobellus limi]SEG35220.1 hypothetical protein SAMN04488133_1983 [Halobellus limi]